MDCPYCKHDDSKVIDSRDSGEGIRRRRQCLDCNRRYTTYEHVQVREILVEKRDGRNEEFNRDKLWSSLTKACAKRPLNVDTINKIVEEIENTVITSGKTQVPARSIGNMVMDKLRELDRVSYIRYASVYRAFSDIETFRDEIDALLIPPTDETTSINQLSFLEDDPLLQPRRRRRGRPRKAATSNS